VLESETVTSNHVTFSHGTLIFRADVIESQCVGVTTSTRSMATRAAR
jgi:hypothetical protein